MIPELQDHPHARSVLAPAVADGTRASHAYLFHGPGGSGKRAVARALAAALLSEGSPNPSDADARVASGAHPDLTWIRPSGAHEILVSDIAEPVVAAASRTPFEASRRVFVIERADELGEEAANRMLKTLEEPPSYVHVILITDRPGDVLPTIRSRCQAVRFDPAPPAEVARALAAQGLAPDTASACAQLALGDANLAAELARAEGASLRAAAESFADALLRGETGSRPWGDLLDAVRARVEALRAELEDQRDEELRLVSAKEQKRTGSEWDDRIKRAARRRARMTLDLGLQLVSLWFADLAALAWGAGELVRNTDRAEILGSSAGVPAYRLLRAIDLVEETRARFVLNVTDELACEALAYRLEQVLAA